MSIDEMKHELRCLINRSKNTSVSKWRLHVALLKNLEKPQEVNRDHAQHFFHKGYVSGHSDTVEGGYADDPRGEEIEFYHGTHINEIIDYIKEDPTLIKANLEKQEPTS